VAPAKLPAPTPEQAAAAAAKRDADQVNARKGQEARAQERVAEHYKRTHVTTGTARPGAGPTELKNLPRPAVQAPGTAGREQSAEAHSAPAK
jgi:hypothetical protein